VSGLDRQIYWLAPLSFLPTIAWVQRRRRGAAACLGVVWLGAAATVAASAMWFRAQPYTLAEHMLDAMRATRPRELAISSASLAATLALTLALLLLPLVAGYVVPRLRAMPRGRAAIGVAAVLAGALFFSRVLHHPAPWMRAWANFVTEYGIFRPNSMALGARTVILGAGVRDLLTIAVFLSCAACAATLWKDRGAAAAERIWRDAAAPALVLGLVFAAAWLPALLVRSVNMHAFDRYLIPFLPLSAIPLIRHYQLEVGARLSRLSWVLLAVFALYGIATTHDAFASGRARLTAAGNLERAGIPRTAISAGFEYDGWTQLEAAGYVNNYQMEIPAGAYRAMTCQAPPDARFWFLQYTPKIRARYVVRLSRSAELADGPIAPVGYTTWLPPARREMYGQLLAGGAVASCQ
jgi:hypothetical protein